MIPANTDPGSVANVWGFMGVAVMAVSATLGPYLVTRRDKPADVPAKVPERVALETAYGVPTDDVSDMAVQLIWSVRQELQAEKRERVKVQEELERVQCSLDRVMGWGANLIANWAVVRQNETPPEMPREPEEER